MYHYCYMQHAAKICNKNQHLRRHQAIKDFSFSKLLKVSKFWNSKFWNSKFWNWNMFWGPIFGVFLGSRSSCPLFQYSLVTWVLTTTDVSTTFPPSFFTVMPMGLTTSPKSRLDRTAPITTCRSACHWWSADVLNISNNISKFRSL